MDKEINRSPQIEQPKKRGLGSLLIEIFGWFGVAAIFGGYLLISFNFLEPEHLLYQLLNLVGGIGIVVESLAKRNYQPAVLNIIWSVVATIALVKIIFFVV